MSTQLRLLGKQINRKITRLRCMIQATRNISKLWNTHILYVQNFVVMSRRLQLNQYPGVSNKNVQDLNPPSLPKVSNNQQKKKKKKREFFILFFLQVFSGRGGRWVPTSESLILGTTKDTNNFRLSLEPQLCCYLGRKRKKCLIPP